MCIPALIAAMTGLGAAGTTAAGAAAAAGTGLSLGGIIQAAGLAATVVGSLAQGNMEAAVADANARIIDRQQQTEAALTATADQRKRSEFSALIGQQRAELAARGVSLDSPTAVLLGKTAARELSFESQSIRSGGQARDAELTAEKQQVLWQGQSARMRGRYSAVGSVLTAAPDLWPGFSEARVGGRVLA
jgi:hypothetical protein